MEAVKNESRDFAQASLFLVVSLKIFMESNLSKILAAPPGATRASESRELF